MKDTYTEAIVSLERWAEENITRWVDCKDGKSGYPGDLGVILDEKGKIVCTTLRTAGWVEAWYIEKGKPYNKIAMETLKETELVDFFMPAYKRRSGLCSAHIRGYDILHYKKDGRSHIDHWAIIDRAQELSDLTKVEHMEDKMGVKEAAEIIGVTPARVGSLISNGSLPAVRVSDVWILKRSDVEYFSKLERKPGRPKKP